MSKPYFSFQAFLLSISLCSIAIFFVEPVLMHADSSSSSTALSLIVDSTIGNNCTGSVSMGTITGTGDTDSGGFNASHAATCTVIVNNSTGYSFGWRISTGTGAAGARTGTGHLNGFASVNNRILAYTPATPSTPEQLSVGATEARWAARLSSTSTTPDGAAITWGADGATDTWLNVATGSTVEIANRTSATTAQGDTQLIGFRTKIGASSIVPTDTYKTVVVFTATTNP